MQSEHFSTKDKNPYVAPMLASLERGTDFSTNEYVREKSSVDLGRIPRRKSGFRLQVGDFIRITSEELPPLPTGRQGSNLSLKLVDPRGIEPRPRQCECRVIPFYYGPYYGPTSLSTGKMRMLPIFLKNKVFLGNRNPALRDSVIPPSAGKAGLNYRP